MKAINSIYTDFIRENYCLANIEEPNLSLSVSGNMLAAVKILEIVKDLNDVDADQLCALIDLINNKKGSTVLCQRKREELDSDLKKINYHINPKNELHENYKNAIYTSAELIHIFNEKCFFKDLQNWVCRNVINYIFLRLNLLPLIFYRKDLYIFSLRDKHEIRIAIFEKSKQKFIDMQGNIYFLEKNYGDSSSYGSKEAKDSMIIHWESLISVL